MRIGIFLGDGGIDDLVAAARTAEADGLDSFWLPQIFGGDAITYLSIIGREVPRIELGTAVVPVQPRHPTALAAQALTAQATSGGRFTLGIGLSHQWVIETMFGLSFDKPVRFMREYLEILGPLIRTGAADVTGEVLSTHAGIDVAGSQPCPIVVAALGPQMLNVAARLADGTVTWMTGPATLESHTIPTLTKAAEAAGNPGPRIVSALPVGVTDDVSAAKEWAARTFSVYGQLPSYRAMLDREGAAGPADVAILGTADEVKASISRMADVGVTDFVAVEFLRDEAERKATREVICSFV